MVLFIYLSLLLGKEFSIEVSKEENVDHHDHPRQHGKIMGEGVLMVTQI